MADSVKRNIDVKPQMLHGRMTILNCYICMSDILVSEDK